MSENQGKREESLNYYLKCKQIREEVLPSNHPDLATIYNNLATLLKNDGKREESLNYYLKSKQIIEQNFYSNHLDFLNYTNSSCLWSKRFRPKISYQNFFINI